VPYVLTGVALCGSCKNNSKQLLNNTSAVTVSRWSKKRKSLHWLYSHRSDGGHFPNSAIKIKTNERKERRGRVNQNKLAENIHLSWWNWRTLWQLLCRCL
jgi:hypothetical protein